MTSPFSFFFPSCFDAQIAFRELEGQLSSFVVDVTLFTPFESLAAKTPDFFPWWSANPAVDFPIS